MLSLIIDPGHGGRDTGGGCNNHFLEKDMNLKISLYQYKRFKELGVSVKLTRYDDKYLSSTSRTNIVKSSGAELCISNHINAGGGEGFEAIYSIHSDGELCKLIAAEVIKEGHILRRVFSRKGSKGDYYYMHRKTGSVKTLIIEYGFADNQTDTKRIITKWKDYAEAVVRAICIAYDIPYTEPAKVVEGEHWKRDIVIKAHAKGLITDLDQWLGKVDEAMPVWAVLSVVMR